MCVVPGFSLHLHYLSGFSHHSGLLTGGPKGAPSIDCSLDYEVLHGVVWGCLSKCWNQSFLHLQTRRGCREGSDGLPSPCQLIFPFLRTSEKPGESGHSAGEGIEGRGPRGGAGVGVEIWMQEVSSTLGTKGSLKEPSQVSCVSHLATPLLPLCCECPQVALGLCSLALSLQGS